MGDIDSSIFKIFIAVALGCDAFSVGLALGTHNLNRRASFRLWFHFGLFQFLMPIIGYGLGSNFVELIHEFDHWVAFFLLAAIASKMLIESLGNSEHGTKGKDPTRGWSLIYLSVATSLDALGVGFGMGVLGADLVITAAYIGIVAGLMTLVGIKLGRILSLRFGKRVETAGAIILFFIAFRLLEI